MRRIINTRSLRVASNKLVPTSSVQSVKFSSEVNVVNTENKDDISNFSEVENKTLVQKLGLDDWKFAIPAAMFVGIPAIHNEVFTIDAEFQVCACFVLFCSTCYTQLGPMLSKSLNESRSEIAKELTALDDAIESQITSGIAQSSAAVEIGNIAKLMYTTKDTIDAKAVSNKNSAEKHLLHGEIVRKLDKLSALEETANTGTRNRMIQAVNADVLNKLTTDKKVKDDALAQAIAVLSGDGKLGKDIIGKSFSDAVLTYKNNYSKLPADKDEIFLQLEKDISAVCTNVELGQGGNIYELKQ